MVTEIEQLRERLDQRDVTIEEIWRYLALAHMPISGMVMQDTAKFISAADIPNFWALHDWWEPVKDKPSTLPTPRIVQFCWYVNHADGQPPLTFMESMTQFYNRAQAHCAATGVDPTAINETAGERKKRLNRERMEAIRGHRRVPDKVLPDDPVLASQVRELEAECETIKVLAKHVDEYWSIEVKRHYDAMLVASGSRKQEAATHKESIENLRTKIRTLTAKQ